MKMSIIFSIVTKYLKNCCIFVTNIFSGALLLLIAKKWTTFFGKPNKTYEPSLELVVLSQFNNDKGKKLKTEVVL